MIYDNNFNFPRRQNWVQIARKRTRVSRLSRYISRNWEALLKSIRFDEEARSRRRKVEKLRALSLAGIAPKIIPCYRSLSRLHNQGEWNRRYIYRHAISYRRTLPIRVSLFLSLLHPPYFRPPINLSQNTISTLLSDKMATWWPIYSPPYLPPPLYFSCSFILQLSQRNFHYRFIAFDAMHMQVTYFFFY